MDKIPSGEDKISKVATEAFEFLRNKLARSAHYSFLDIGCGNGRDIDYLSSEFENFTFRGIDISQGVIERVRDLTSGKDNVSFECMDWKDLDNAQYDIIYMSGVYHFFPLAERRAFRGELKNILTPEGFFFLSTLSSNDTQYYGQGEAVEGDPNSFQSEYFLHFSSERELRKDFGFLRIVELSEYFHKNYAHDTDYHRMRLLIGEYDPSF